MNLITAEQGEAMVAAARDQLGVEWVHQGRTPGVELDCLGLVVHAAASIGIQIPHYADYERWPRPDVLRARTLEVAQRISPGIRRPGDLLILRIVQMPVHFVLVTGADSLIHAYTAPPIKSVVETRMGHLWENRIVDIFRFYAPE